MSQIIDALVIEFKQVNEELDRLTEQVAESNRRRGEILMTLDDLGYDLNKL